MPNESSQIVQRLWNYCNVLRDDGVSYGDYVEQLTYLLFLKMADEQERLSKKKTAIPEELGWQSLVQKDGDDLEVHYRHTLTSLGKEKGMLGVIFRKAQNKIQDPAKLKRLVELINAETWIGMEADVKGDIYEGLLEKNAEDIKSGAGQYFTPRALINAMVAVMKPQPRQTICDPACGTGGFFLASHAKISKLPNLDIDDKKFLKFNTFKGWEIVDSAARLCVMNLFLHGIGGEDSPVVVGDSLATDPGTRFNIVMTNPPFGKKSSVTIVNGEGKADRESIVYERQDFWATTSNKQLNFVQHIKTLLKINGRAAVVVPDNVLFEGGAGETVRKKLLSECDVHTLLRLPTGIFYAQGVKANVIFFDRKPASEKPWTDKLWIYDLRTNKHFTLKTNSLKFEDLKDFIQCYNPDNRHDRKETERFKSFTYEDIIKRDKTSLDIFWLKDESLEDSANLPDPELIATEIADNLEAALEQFKEITDRLRKNS
ncbi:MAG: type I restriction-modification system subunit M [Bacteroidetes bacterium]|nr:type I restriction-modification system subunit M [Bacteroidota bacterium]MBU1421811.1 type I restriction-modification system subunit M [Bacteroidota bacterium]MBU2471469.1 type I restriction-modification system subunit M [Bacteroidota bacterium]MBU2635841.1 type I restriction-modification system subunit M [Bacteroidota bacterium]